MSERERERGCEYGSATSIRYEGTTNLRGKFVKCYKLLDDVHGILHNGIGEDVEREWMGTQ